jgi:lysophospholipase L1-like esterase
MGMPFGRSPVIIAQMLGIGFCLGGAKAESARGPAVVLLGDSITAGTDWNALLPSFDVANRGISSDTTDGVLGRIDKIVAMHPRCVALMIGINDLLSVKPKSVQQISENYTAIVDRLSASGSSRPLPGMGEHLDTTAQR